jgi:hypothetical protein
MIGSLWTLVRFIGSVAVYYVTPTPPDFVVVYAESHGDDITPDVLSWFAVCYVKDTTDTTSKRPWKDLIIHYKYKGRGPYIVYYDTDDTPFPPKSLVGKEDITKLVENCIISAELSSPSSSLTSTTTEPLDITERAEMFAGPDGLWDGRLDREKPSWDRLDPLIFYPQIKKGDIATISFANGDEIQLSY